VINDLGWKARVVDYDVEAPATECGVEDDLAVKVLISEVSGIERQDDGIGFEEVRNLLLTRIPTRLRSQDGARYL
jgi:hypothetical protein